MNKKSLIEEKTIKEAQKYEFDKKQIFDYYGIKKKEKPVYNVVQKKIIFAKENTINKIDKKLKYSNYLIFRSLLQSEFDFEDMKEEMENGLEMINYSKNIRNYLYRHFNIDKNEIYNTISKLNNKNYINSFSENKKININSFLLVDDFLKNCRLLKMKENNNIN